MLSAGPRLRGHRDAQRELVAELDGAGTTALGFGIQPVFENVPAALLAEARERSFPVFAVPPSTPFRDIVSAVNRCLMSGDLVNYERLSSMQRYLMDALQEDEPERAVISRLAKLVDARVLVFDPGGRLEMATGRGAGGGALARGWPPGTRSCRSSTPTAGTPSRCRSSRPRGGGRHGWW